MRREKFQNDCYYHIFNRGVDKRKVFCDMKDYVRFLESLREFNFSHPIDSLYRQKQLKRKKASKSLRISEANRSGLDAGARPIEIICYALIPNHYHLLVKQKKENGISIYMHKLGLGYTAYFNSKYNRTGALFAGTFKAAPIKTDGRFLEASLYINGNYEIHGLGKAKDWTWSSCRDYLGLRNGSLCDKNIIMSDFSGPKEYNDLLADYIKDKRQWKREAKILEQ